jgi:hypothetical protein
MDFKCGAALASGHSKQVTATMPMLHVHSSILSVRTTNARCSADQPAGYKRSRRQHRARVTAALNAAAIVLSLAAIALILVIA